MQTLYKKLKDFVEEVVPLGLRQVVSSIFYEKQVHHPLGLRVGVSNSVLHGTPTTSIAVDESSIYGRANDKKKLKGFLLSDDACEGDGKIGVVSIVGVGGLGKTTLAKLLYNDPDVNKKFNLKGWAHVSKDFDVLKLTKALLESITEKSTEATNLDTVQVQLQKMLNGKMFLLVLDDIWVVNYVAWDCLMNISNVGEAGSRIIITTRDERIALTMQTFLPIHKLECLEAEDCWSLLAKHAFGESNNQQRSDLEEIGRAIAQKCDGLPLAVVALGGLLRIKLSQDDWNHVLENNIWQFPNTRVNSTLQPAALQLSYHYLPGNLKRCFAYCAIFPKNYKCEKETIVQLWIAEGLVLQPKSEKSWEKVAEEYFDELVSRSLIQRQSVDGKEIFEMHDLMNDLATRVSYPYCVRLDEHKVIESLEMVRHLSYNRNANNSYNKFDRLFGLKGLHTFLSLPLHERGFDDYCMSNNIVGDLLLEMEHLHLLSLAHCSKITRVPTSIGNLIYLRYLNLSGTDILRLPSETCKLVNLQTLIVSECSSLTELPGDMGELVSLRNLDVSNTPLREMPVQITKLKNLQTLSDFIISKQWDGLKVGELGKFPHLRRKLSISELQNVTDHSDASQANLETKKQIEQLKLKWHNPAPSDSDSQIQNGVLEQLQPTVNLKSLTIDGYGGIKFPNWLSDSSYGNMAYLKIKNCDNCSNLPHIGQLGNLKELFVERMKSVKSIGAEFYGSGGGPSFQPFPSLETLSFEDMPKWEEWNLIGGMTTEFPSLRSLTLKQCPELKGNIPANLPVLKTLTIKGCEKVKSIVIAEDASQHQILFPLRNVTIEICDELESISFGGIGLGLSIPNLEYLRVYWCKKLRSLLEPMNTLVGLHSMELLYLPNLESSGKDGFPINLLTLSIGGCIGEDWWNRIPWERLTCLTFLSIDGGDMVEAVMKMEVPLLPTSLVNLWLLHLDDIERLDGKWLQHLTSLQKLLIREAPNLKSLPEKEFPFSLSELRIYDCPLLEATLQDKEGKEWSKIAHIPTIEINGNRIK